MLRFSEGKAETSAVSDRLSKAHTEHQMAQWEAEKANTRAEELSEYTNAHKPPKFAVAACFRKV